MAGEKPSFGFGRPAHPPAPSSASGSGGMFGGTPSAPTPFGTNNASSTLFGAGTPASTPGGNGGLFGSATPATSGGSGPGLFGAIQQKPLFGAVPTLTPQNNSSGIFANAGGEQPKPSLFSGASGFSFPAPTTTPTSAAPTPILFGAKPTASPAATPGEQPKSGGLFGAAPGQSIFGSTTPAPTAKTPGLTFGPPTPAAGEQNKPAQSLFGGATPAAAPTGQSLFSAAATPGGSTTPQPNKQAAPVSFTPAGNPPQNLFGAKKDENQQPASNLFGSAAASTATSQASGTSTAAPFSGFPLGGNKSAAPAQPATTGAATPTFGGFNLGGQSSAASQPPATSTAAPSLFSATPASTARPAATGTASTPFGGFNLGGGQSSAAAQPSATTTAPPASGAAPTAGGSNLFSGGGLCGSTATTSAGPAAQTGQTGTSNLFSTTTPAPTQPLSAAANPTGPTPPHNSRLSGKTMDEILTTWSTSLASHQKQFQHLAQRVAVWDRMLVSNSGEISTLYGRCFQAERDCAEVERQLSGVEHGQLELEGLLDRYEGEVERMLEQAGLGDGVSGSTGGVDGERERTYKAAEQCSTRLTEMSHNITEMIEEVNSASTKLSSNTRNPSQAANDPLTEIVRVLNSHLSQLQTIDEGAEALQGRVIAAQREARNLGQSQTLNGHAGQWVDGFGRSYLGRR